MVVKPSEETPLCAFALGVLAQRAGIPPGVLGIITGRAAEIGEVLTSSEVVRKISFTGSTAVGKGAPPPPGYISSISTWATAENDGGT